MSWFSSAYASNMFSTGSSISARANSSLPADRRLTFCFYHALTGCHFFSAMHLFSPAHDTLKVLPWDYRLNGKVTTPLFQHLGASSWHKGDAKFILNLGKVRLERTSCSACPRQSADARCATAPSPAAPL